MKKEINLNNKYRVLLTEVLPNELPLMFGNEAFYQNMLDEDLRKIFNEAFNSGSKNKKSTKEWTIPFDYSIRKYGGDKSRTMSIMHPVSQLKCVDFYAANDYYMLYLCRNSPFSIRYINDRSTCIFNVEDQEQDDEPTPSSTEDVSDSETEKVYRSYFSYKQYDMMYKFFGSGDFLRLEQKYTHLMKMDVANCFYHIYTHTISWAIKGKEAAKAQIKENTFEKSFDKLMQSTNYNETNGIIVGPEISRIFAEIILQRIDVNVLNLLKQEPYNLKLGRDYEVRRYVDDHYIFANNEEDLHSILDVYRKELQFYKLFINESKLEFIERPFVSSVTEAKREINKLVDDISTRWLKKDENGKYTKNIRNEMKAFQYTVNDFRFITYRSGQKYGVLNRYFLSLIISKLKSESECDSASCVSADLLLMFAEVAFYVFSLDMSVTASIKLCRILELLHRWAEKCDDKTVTQELESRIYREVKRCLDINHTSKRDGETNIEVMNILIVLRFIMNTPIQRVHLLKLFNLASGEADEYEKLDYFQICSLLYIVGDDPVYADVRKRIVIECERRIMQPDSMIRADNALLFFDIITCPHVNKKEVKEIIKKVYGCNDSAYGNKYNAIRKTKRWFFDWDRSGDLSAIISKKEYHSPYE